MSEETTIVYEERKDELRIFRAQAVLVLSPWAAKQRLMLEISPAVAGVKGQPKPGEKRFEYDKKIRISFTTAFMLQFSYDLQELIKSGKGEIKKFADMSKSVGDDSDKKTLSVIARDNGDIGFALFKGTDKVNISITKSDAYAIVKHIEFVYQYFIFSALSNGANNGNKS